MATKSMPSRIRSMNASAFNCSGVGMAPCDGLAIVGV